MTEDEALAVARQHKASNPGHEVLPSSWRSHRPEPRDEVPLLRRPRTVRFEWVDHASIPGPFSVVRHDGHATVQMAGGHARDAAWIEQLDLICDNLGVNRPALPG
jgi:hypothetical protein